ncbi:phosphoserine phosphatase SerB [Halomonas daqingensis]|uniref:Phosphoserine phosphatase n=1 Tax=Billgrantia desiderata TaxID=52021 RepID=A0AAW4YT22_9GAMM|nr:phosphoserine phosphatase SerB [Halomonas desiderata]MCE8010573.1 phosphoserine phosphatase SerB [Halomonas desiderata]MCE8030682.1 phosphoserine phosphatase SerB [Halomonas desiderata]MCE8051553.1 phosphoserine phosphatase SerB [Halomonas desiderata]NIC35186.1 phosphoserine phosphatase SerB [Halomonas desiderata]OUE37096.1 phosphoserine phosphatase SerB [Halomonas desiderata SP1]
MTRRLLIRATGAARPGQLAGLGQALARSGARLLDINQSVTFGMVSLEALVGLEHDSDLEGALNEVGDSLGLDVQAIQVSAEDYQRWSSQASEPRLILTLLAPHLPAGILAEVGALTAEHGLTVELIHRLSGREPLDGGVPRFGSCVECWLRGEEIDLDSLREKALALGAMHGVDIAIQEDSIWRRHRRLVCFDMDSTLIQAEVIDELARRHGVYEEVAAVTERAMRGELDFQQSFRERMAKLKGLDEAVLAEIAEELPLMDGVERLMKHLKRLGYRTAILSGGFTYFARHLQETLGFDEIHANELVIENGKVTGEVREPILDASRKAELLREIAAREGLAMEQTIAVGDGANDLKMLAAAGLGIAFRAKPLVRSQARQSISTLGIDAVLYLMGYREGDLEDDSRAG